MALLWLDGFESYGTSGEADISFSSKYYCEEDTVRPHICAGRTANTYAIYLKSTDIPRFRTPQLTTNRTLIVGFYAYLYGTQCSGATLVTLRDPSADGATTGSYQAIDLQYSTANSGNELSLLNGTTVLQTSNVSGLTINTWHHIELKVYCADSGGTFEVRLDGNTVLSSNSADTKFHSSWDYFAQVGFRTAIGLTTSNIIIDDVYVMDASGSAPFNDFLGPGFVVKDIYPVSDVASGNWSITGNASAYATVNEISENLASYISANAASKRTMFELTSNTFNTSDNIIGVMSSTWGVAQVGCIRGCKVATAQGTGTINYSANTAFMTDNSNTSVGGSCITYVYETDPDNNSWNATLVDGLRVGVETA